MLAHDSALGANDRCPTGAGLAATLERGAVNYPPGGRPFDDPAATRQLSCRSSRGMTAVATRRQRRSPGCRVHLEIDDSDAVWVRLLYEEHAAPLWRYAVRLTGDRARAEDVVQETLVRAWQHAQVADDSERSVRAWLFTVARNLIADERRSSRFRKEVSSLDGAPESAGADEVGTALDRVLIADALAQLSSEHRAVVWRSYYMGWTTKEIADDLDIPDGTAKSRLHNALRALRLTIQKSGVTQ
jgi:RNA polymerase sigma-70 factor, ECF subfamily